MSTPLQLEFRLSQAQRDRLAVFADLLISGGAGLPAATEVDVAGAWIDRALGARPDLVETVVGVLAEEGEPAEVLARLRAQEPERFDAFAFIVAGAYLIHPRVRKLLGYPGGAPEPSPAFPDEADAYLEDGILDVVIERGPTYRPTPQTA
ncbi:hypothetical protein HC028_23600 [Planosporangium flavigriseum]|uniref:hypothetical protein n=1 Tax=Planosporangium flavigriseum TaxID=373681 RepID=UPI00143946FE|nr:hypothetical protein [Planosporangium flavigriseum]NJC67461.1 hypothetical protein [Planosporangium flavigriseum]